MKQQLRNRSRLIIFALISLFTLGKNEPEWAITEDGSKYLIENKYEYSWFESLHECAKRNLSLAAIDTAEKNFNLVNLLKNRFGTGVDLWISGTESTVENSKRKFVWALSGKAFNFANWEIGEPNNLDGNQPCVHIWSKTNNFTWADGQSHLKYGYICEETFLTNYRQIMARKRQTIKHLLSEVLFDVKKKQKHLKEINEGQGDRLQEINNVLETNLERSIVLIDRLLEEL